MLERLWETDEPKPGSLAVADYLDVEEYTVLDQIQRWTRHADKSLADCAKRFLRRDGLAMVQPPPPQNPFKADDFGEWEPELHKLLTREGYEQPAMYCLTDRVKGKYRQPYREEKDPESQSAVNTIRVMADGKPTAIGKHLTRLGAVIAPPEDRVFYYVPKEIRNEAIELSKRLSASVRKPSV